MSLFRQKMDLTMSLYEPLSSKDEVGYAALLIAEETRLKNHPLYDLLWSSSIHSAKPFNHLAIMNLVELSLTST